MTKEQRDALLYQPKNGYDRLTQAEEQELNAYCEAYKSFLDRSKTERECVFTAIAEAEARGFVQGFVLQRILSSRMNLTTAFSSLLRDSKCSIHLH